MPNINKLTQQEKQAIIDKSPLTMPTNPTKSGWTDIQIKQRFSKMVTDETDSVLSALDKVVENVNDILDISVGNVVVLTSIPADLTEYEGFYILIKDASNNIKESYFVQNGIAIAARFGAINNIVVSEEEPEDQLEGDIWYDID
jgi:hypothetical protein